mmetsp:Transcript_33252/g.103657  ORF Transcript_33252/g.103657 Transcript_33252/m.103657 type:complete len:236 (-) Transcript_33252:2-709(-)
MRGHLRQQPHGWAPALGGDEPVQEAAEGHTVWLQPEGRHVPQQPQRLLPLPRLAAGADGVVQRDDVRVDPLPQHPLQQLQSSVPAVNPLAGRDRGVEDYHVALGALRHQCVQQLGALLWVPQAGRGIDRGSVRGDVCVDLLPQHLLHQRQCLPPASRLAQPRRHRAIVLRRRCRGPQAADGLLRAPLWKSICTQLYHQRLCNVPRQTACLHGRPEPSQRRPECRRHCGRGSPCPP